jgi:hypothetical protein
MAQDESLQVLSTRELQGTWAEVITDVQEVVKAAETLGLGVRLQLDPPSTEDRVWRVEIIASAQPTVVRRTRRAAPAAPDGETRLGPMARRRGRPTNAEREARAQAASAEPDQVESEDDRVMRQQMESMDAAERAGVSATGNPD